MTVQEKEIDKAFSVFEAAKEAGGSLAICANDKRISYRELAELVAVRQKRLSDDYPYPLVAKPDLTTIVTVYALLEKHQPILLLHPGLTDFEKKNLLNDVSRIVTPLPKNTAVVIFTSGTSGKPKPAVLSRRALYASAESSSANIPLDVGDVWLLSISPARIGGFSILTRSLKARSAVGITPKFSVRTFLETLENENAAYASIVPTMLQMIFDQQPDWTPKAHLKSLLVGGAPISENLKKEAARKKIPIILTYGMTETSSNVVTTPFSERFQITEGCGKKNPDVEIKSPGETLMIRGPMLMTGYWGKEPLREGQWFDSSDIGEIKADGTVKVFARRTDLIISGGENIYPAEVEEALEKIEGIKEALVLGKPDETWGKIVTALLVAEPGKEKISDQKIVDSLRPILARYKSPRRIAWVESIPKSSAMKPTRNQEILEDIELRTLHYTK